MNAGLLDYLRGGLVSNGSYRADLDVPTLNLAMHWTHLGVEGPTLELAAETLARLALEVPEGTVVRADELVGALDWIELPPPVIEFLRAAVGEGRERVGLAAVAVHLLDLAEGVTFEVLLPELPALWARSERTGDAARHVGLARHLKG